MVWMCILLSDEWRVLYEWFRGILTCNKNTWCCSRSIFTKNRVPFLSCIQMFHQSLLSTGETSARWLWWATHLHLRLLWNRRWSHHAWSILAKFMRRSIDNLVGTILCLSQFIINQLLFRWFLSWMNMKTIRKSLSCSNFGIYMRRILAKSGRLLLRF